MSDTKEVLQRLKRRIGRERARCARMERAAYERKDSTGRERACGEFNVLSLAMGFIDDEVKKTASIDEVMKSMEPCNKGTDSYDDLDYNCVLGQNHKGECDDGQGNKRDRRKKRK